MECIVHDCDKQGVNVLGVRLRRPDTTAIWAPNTGALFCDFHSSTGVRLSILVESTISENVQTSVSSVGLSHIKSTPIRRSSQ